MADDPSSGDLLMFGGRDGETTFSDAWRWNGHGWVARIATSAPPRRVVLDESRGILIGLVPDGNGGTRTVRWADSTWIEVGTIPQPRASDPNVNALAFDVLTGTVCLLMADPSQSGLETWTWNGTTWHKEPAAGPPFRSNFSMGYDPKSRTVIMFGGATVAGPQPSPSDTWSWNGGTWTKLQTAHSPAAGPAYSAYDEANQELILLDSSGSTWSWTGSDWILRAAGNGPGYRLFATSAYSKSTHQVILYGGKPNGGDNVSSETWAWDGKVWTQPVP